MTKTEVLQALVRPIITLGFAAAVIAGFFIGKLGAEALLGPAGMALGFYFQRRDSEKPPPPTP